MSGRPGDVPVFGEPEAGASYRPRPGSYAILLDAEGRVLIMRFRDTWRLPGGGHDPGETPEQALRREVMEETGHTIQIVRAVGVARQYGWCEAEGHMDKECHFFVGHAGEGLPVPSEPDHEPHWMGLENATSILYEGAQRWAVEQVLATRGTQPSDLAP